MQSFIFKFGIWFNLIAMLMISILAIKAYRQSLKKVFILLMIISIPISFDGLLYQINHYLIRSHHRSLSSVIFGRDYLTELQPPEFRKMNIELYELHKENEAKRHAIEEKYSVAISEHSRKTWPKSLWMYIKHILTNWLFPVGVIILCRNEIKSSNQGQTIFRSNNKERLHKF